MPDSLLPLDIVNGASVPDAPGLYVLGCYDRRITFYAQQVRALNLVYALNSLGHFSNNPRVAVIGGGAAGLSVATASVLSTQGDVVLFEREGHLLPLQAPSARRRIDPHIFDWPEWDSNSESADLPVLDWRAGPAREVRENILFEFSQVCAASDPRLQRKTRHLVQSITRVHGRFEARFERDARAGEIGRVVESDFFDLVFLAFGFGLEPNEVIQGIPNQSYWSDAGVPEAEFAGRVHPRFVISGNGDGALIDFVAAGSAAFNHAQMIGTIIRHPGIDALFEPLRVADTSARAAESAGLRFDYFSVYEATIFPLAQEIGLVAVVQSALRLGVQLTLHTQHPEMFVAATSTLNRLSAYLIMKACEREPQTKFVHIHGPDIVPSPPPDPSPYTARYWLRCGTQTIGADVVIARRGPNRAAARQPYLRHFNKLRRRAPELGKCSWG